MKYLSGILFCILPLCLKVDAQNGNYVTGARAMGISGTSITLSDAFSALNNIGALASHKDITAYFSSSMLYGIPGLMKMGAGLSCGLLGGITAINLFRFGDGLFNEHKLGIGYSHKVRFISLGLQVNYIQYTMEGYGSAGVVCFEFGGRVEICPQILFGAYIFNPTQANPYKDNGSILPVLLRSGLSYRPVDHLMMNVEYYYYVFLKHCLSFGLEYIIREKIMLRTGITLETLRSTFGIGFKPGRFRIDYAADVHPLLGISHEFSVTLNIKYK
jgi:hypothetical protein